MNQNLIGIKREIGKIQVIFGYFNVFSQKLIKQVDKKSYTENRRT